MVLLIQLRGGPLDSGLGLESPPVPRNQTVTLCRKKLQDLQFILFIYSFNSRTWGFASSDPTPVERAQTQTHAGQSITETDRGQDAGSTQAPLVRNLCPLQLAGRTERVRLRFLESVSDSVLRLELRVRVDSALPGCRRDHQRQGGSWETLSHSDPDKSIGTAVRITRCSSQSCWMPVVVGSVRSSL